MHRQSFSGQIRPADLDRSDDARAVVVLLNAYAEDAMGAGECSVQYRFMEKRLLSSA
ncbi:hypothetical protein [Thiocapsa sp.]|uniref:hypothetical protein n=1 Tax=Thiocapsa sp. TaxID=2024551 RepID=UPI002C3FC333|nr:hypothetical protein [Thiocapsa sp.]HSO82749.1 hypothetical protein [Thiocapsa sp.]